MRKRFLITAFIVPILVCFGLYVFWKRPLVPGFNPGENILSAETRGILESSDHFFLFSLYPMPILDSPEANSAPNEVFHDYEVLGKTEIRDAKERAELLRALYRGIKDSNGMVASCFNPRHGIRAVLGGHTVDLVICFECLSIKIYDNDTHSKGVLTTDSPKAVFNGSLKKAKLQVAEKP